MIKGISKTFAISVLVLLLIGLSGCSKDTSIVDKIAKEQYGSENSFKSEESTKDKDIGNTGDTDYTGNAEDTGSVENTGNTKDPGNIENIENIDSKENIENQENRSGSITEGIDVQRKDSRSDQAMEEDGASKRAQVSGNEDDPAVDVDLTKLSSTMVYSEVYNMMNRPEDYVGKTIKMEGLYYASYWESTQKYYHCVLINDAAACCQNGIEFVWDNDTHVYPDEYPADNTWIELTGVFGLYEEDGQQYCYLKTDAIRMP